MAMKLIEEDEVIAGHARHQATAETLSGVFRIRQDSLSKASEGPASTESVAVQAR